MPLYTRIISDAVAVAEADGCVGNGSGAIQMRYRVILAADSV
jgi:hypothetical protein